MRAYGRMEDGTTRALLVLLRNLRDGVNSEILAAPSPDTLQLRQFRDMLEQHIATFEAQAEAELRAAQAGTFRLGQDMVLQPLASLGYRVTPLSGALLASVTAQSADLVRTISADAIKAINLQVRMAALGQIQPLDAMRAITRQFGLRRLSPGKLITRGVGYNAERILRTELNRTFNLAHYAQQQVGQEQIDLRKRWIATADSRTRASHLRVHMETLANPIPTDQPFIVGGAKMMYPGDPAGPPEESIQCRCTMAVIVQEIGVISSPLDAGITQRLEKAA